MTDNSPSDPAALRSNRGGRRPGAGAPKGNVNALRTGAYSRSAANAIKLIHVLPVLNAYYQQLRARTGARAIQQQRNLIEAAQHVLDTHPHLAHELKSLIEASLTFRLWENRRFEHILNDLRKPAPAHLLEPTRHLRGGPDLFVVPMDRVLKHTAWLCRNDVYLHILLTNHVRPDLEIELARLARNTIKQSEPDPPPSRTLPSPGGGGTA